MERGGWAGLWEDLARHDQMTGDAGEAQMVERWRRLARRLDADPASEVDPLLDFVLARVEPGDTVVDIGSGVGRWTLPLAARAARVTAIEPVPAMRAILEQRLAAHGARNVAVVAAPWADAAVPEAEWAVAVHSMYTSPDLMAFVRKMEGTARTCCLVMRIPAADGVMGELAESVRGRWHDSPNFIVGYNVLLEAGIYPNVLVEEQASRSWVDPTMEDAVARARRHLRLDEGSHDDLIRTTLRRRLVRSDGGFRWPDGMRSALCWWRPGLAGTA